jgi:hypothetical protein
MASFSSIFQWTTEPIIFFLDCVLLFLLFRKKLYRQLKFFCVYIVILCLLEPAGFWISFLPWFLSPAWSTTYWSIQFVLSLLRLLTIAEISRRSLVAYPAVWSFGWRMLSAAAAILFSWTAYSAFKGRHHFRIFIAVGGQRFEIMQVILLLLVLFLGVYYHVRISQLNRMILIGICIFSAIQIANDPLLLAKIPADSVFGYIRPGSFLIPMMIWTYAVWRWGGTSTAPPDLISQEKYDELSPQIHDRLQELNDKLSDLTGKRRR